MAVPISLDNPLFSAYLFYAMIVLLKMLLIPLVLTGPTRVRKQAFMYPEDDAYFGEKKKETKPIRDDPDVERTRKIHHNDLENIPAFVLVGLFYVICEPSLWLAVWHFRIYAVSRVLHTMFYQMGVQPHRAIAHFIGYLTLLSMSVQVIISVW